MGAQHWRELCILNRTLKWIRPETKDGVTVTRCKFGKDRRGYAMMKVEGVLESDPDTVYNFIKISTREGGKVRGEGVGEEGVRGRRGREGCWTR